MKFNPLIPELTVTDLEQTKKLYADVDDELRKFYAGTKYPLFPEFSLFFRDGVFDALSDAHDEKDEAGNQ